MSSVETVTSGVDSLFRGFHSFVTFETVQNTVRLRIKSYRIDRQAAVNCWK
jgi:hypothetical protein